MPAPKTLGNLGTNRPRTEAGRNIDTWTFSNGLPGEKSIEVKVNLISAKDGDIAFTASAEILKTIEDKDINSLRKKVEDTLRTVCEDHSGIVWEDWLEVTVVGSHSKARYDDTKTRGLSISYKPLPRGVTSDGRVLTVHAGNRIVLPFPKPHRSAADINPEEMVFDDRNSGTEISYIKATPENIAALENLQARLNLLRNSLSDLLSQEKVGTSLPNLSTMPLALAAK